jgi:hypothetical protein
MSTRWPVSVEKENIPAVMEIENMRTDFGRERAQGSCTEPDIQGGENLEVVLQT